jgi:hypothetical protein
MSIVIAVCEESKGELFIGFQVDDAIVACSKCTEDAAYRLGIPRIREGILRSIVSRPTAWAAKKRGLGDGRLAGKRAVGLFLRLGASVSFYRFFAWFVGPRVPSLTG